MGGPELVRSRQLIVGGYVLALACTAMVFWPAHGRFAGLLGYAGAALMYLTVALVGLVLQLRGQALRGRRPLPLRFVETTAGLGAVAGTWAAMCALVQTTAIVAVLASSAFLQRLGVATDSTGAAYTRGYNVAVTALLVLLVVAAIPTVAFVWRGICLELTPAGVRIRGPLFDRLVPWQSLAPGGPPRPGLKANFLALVVTRPELIVQHGWSFGDAGWGPRHRPKVILQVMVHPWLVADAIRWYVEHPAERDALGTPGAQDRLISALSVPQPAYAWPTGR